MLLFLMTHKTIMIGLVAISLVVGSSSIVTSYASDHQNGTPFLQEELDAIEEIVLGLQDQLDNVMVSWTNVTGVPAGFADDIDNDLLAGFSCSTDQIIKYDGNANIWQCADTGDGSTTVISSAGMDCNTIRFMLGQSPQLDTRDGCDLEDAPLDIADISGADLSGAYMFGAIFDGGKAVGVNFSGAELRQMDFYETDLSGVNFSGANLDGAYFDQAINQPTGSIDCIGTPNDATFTCTG